MSLAELQQQAQTFRPQLTKWHTSHLSDNVAPVQQQAIRATSGTAGSKPAQLLTQQGIVHARASRSQGRCRLLGSPAGTWMEVMLRDRLQKMRRLTSRQDAATSSVQLGRSSLRGGGPGGKATPAYMRQGCCLAVVGDRCPVFQHLQGLNKPWSREQGCHN